MVRDQLLCIVVPTERGRADEVAALLGQPAMRQDLDRLFRAMQCVHFACIALLPPWQRSPGALPHPDLLLELAVDPGLSRTEVVDALLQTGLEALWTLYAPLVQPPHANRRAQLRELLLRHASRADGGYVGYRDRTVRQIDDEAKLFLDARAAIADARQRQPHAHSGTLVRAATALVAPGGPHRFAAEQAPRGAWRRRWITPRMRLAMVAGALVVPALLLIAAMLGGLAGIGIAAIAAGSTAIGFDTAFGRLVFFDYARYSVHAVASVIVTLMLLETIAGMLLARVMSVTAAVLAVFGIFVLLLLVPYIGVQAGARPSILDFLGAVGVLTIWGAGVLVFLLILGAAAGVLLAVALAISPPHLGLRALLAVSLVLLCLAGWALHEGLGMLVAIDHPAVRDFGPLRALREGTPRWGIAPADAVVLWLLVFTAIGVRLMRMAWVALPRLWPIAARADRPRLYDVEAAQQCHPRIAECEAALTGRASHMLSVTDVRDTTVWHRWMLRLLLRTITFVGEAWYTEGRLGDASGIKFGHWHLIDGGRRLLFCSNYDGSFGGYLDEFINGASQGINLIWRWTELRPRPAAVDGHPAVTRRRSFPPTRLLALRGCKHEQWFKAFARDSMVPHVYRFEAYRHTNQDIERATRLRDALRGERSLVKDDVIMRCVES